MRYIWWLIGLCIGLCGVQLGAWTAQYSEGAPMSLRVTVGATSVGPGQTVRLTVQASDEDSVLDARGNVADRINDPVRVTWEATGGTLSKRSVSNDPVELQWQAPARSGSFAVYITADDSGRFADEPAQNRVVQFTVTRAGEQAVPTVRVGANPQTIRLDERNTSTITAQVFGDNAAGQPVRFFATGGRLSAGTVNTDGNGRASVRLTVNDGDLGTITVTASTPDSTSSTTVQVIDQAPQPNDPGPIIMPPPPVGNNPPGFIVSITPASIPADGESTADVRVRLTDSRGLPIPRQNVIFRSTAGAIAPRMSVTDYYGYAVAQITAPTEPGGAYVIVDIGALKGYGTIIFTPVEDEPGGADDETRVFLTIDPTEQMADGASRVRVEAMVLDGKNRPLTNTAVAFSTTLGRLLQAKGTTDDEGKATTTLIAPDRPGLAVVTAVAENITAASQVEFTGGTPGQAGLQLTRWTGQQTFFAAPNWVLRQIDLGQNNQAATAAELRILDDTGRGVRTVQLGASGVLILDQYGQARGYALEENDKANLVLLTPDGTVVNTIVFDVPPGSDVRDVRYADPAGNLLVAIAQPDGTRPQVRGFAKNGNEVLTLNQGLEALPVMALGGDGFLAMAFPGGAVRLYNATGDLVFEGRRTDGLQATQTAVGPNGEYVAIASALANQTERPPVVSVFGRGGGAPLATFKLEATLLTPVSYNTLAVATPDRTVLLNLQTKNIAWQISGTHQRFLAVNDTAVLAGHHGDGENGIQSRITLVRLQDGRLILSQPFDTGTVLGLLPPDDSGAVGILSSLYAFRFKLPGK